MYKYLVVLVAVVALTQGANSEANVVGGTEANIEDYPYQLALESGVGPEAVFLCGASIISEKCLLTAAHCIALSDDTLLNVTKLNVTQLNAILRDVNNITVRSGSSYYESGGHVHRVISCVVHRNYSYVTNEYDFAVCKINDTFPLGTPGCQSVPLATVEPNAGVMANVSGWGTTSEDGDASDVLMAAVVPIVDRTTCNEMYGDDSIKDSMICAGYPEGGKDTCYGDSGGPLTVSNPPKLAGVTSWGEGCARPNRPGVYSNVALERHWIILACNGTNVPGLL